MNDEPDYKLAFRIALVALVAPIVVGVVRNGLAHWYPTNDAALTAIYVKDVFSAHIPLVGLPARYSYGAAPDYFYPGALLMYLLAVPVRIFGVSWGLLVGMGAIQSAWTLTALWLIRRRVGYRHGLVGALFLASLLWGLGSQVILDPTPVLMGSIAFFAFLVATWSVADGDAHGFVPLALGASFLFLDHLKFAIVVPVLVGVACVGFVLHRRAFHRETIDDAPALRRTTVIAFGATALFTALVWAGPIVQQLTSAHPNMTALAHAIGSGDRAQRAVTDTLRVVSTPLTTWPLWLRHSLADPSFTVTGPSGSVAVQLMGFAIVLISGVAVALRGQRGNDTTVRRALIVALVAWLAWVVSAQISPDRSPFERNYFQAVWPMATFIWFTIVIGALRAKWNPTPKAARVTPDQRRWMMRGTLGVIVAFSISNFAIANFNATTPQVTISVARTVRDVVHENVHDGPVLVRSSAYPARTYFPVALLALREHNIAFRVTGSWDPTVYGEFRKWHGEPMRELIIANSNDTPPGARRLAAVVEGPLLTQREFDRITDQVISWLSAQLDEPHSSTAQQVKASIADHDPHTLVTLMARAGVRLPAGAFHVPLPIPSVSKSDSAAWWHDATTTRIFVFLRQLK